MFNDVDVENDPARNCEADERGIDPPIFRVKDAEGICPRAWTPEFPGLLTQMISGATPELMTTSSCLRGRNACQTCQISLFSLSVCTRIKCSED